VGSNCGSLHFGPSSDKFGLIRALSLPEHSLPESAMPLTKRQREILNYLTSLHRAKRLRPELRGDRRDLRLQLAGDGARTPEQPRAQGYITRAYNEKPGDHDPPQRGDAKGGGAPLLGAVAAGYPIEAVTHDETITVPESFVGRSGKHYCAACSRDVDDRRADPRRRTSSW